MKLDPWTVEMNSLGCLPFDVGCQKVIYSRIMAQQEDSWEVLDVQPWELWGFDSFFEEKSRHENLQFLV